jgi:hypothetical protein
MLYIFEHPKTGEIIELVQRMKEEHKYTDEEGVRWKRVYTSPGATIDTHINNFSNKEFVDKTRGKGMTMGQLWDESAEASKKREKTLGKDPVKEKYFKDYSKRRSGMKHKQDPSNPRNSFF